MAWNLVMNRREFLKTGSWAGLLATAMPAAPLSAASAELAAAPVPQAMSGGSGPARCASSGAWRNLI